ncbi:dynamin family protein [Fusobacterium polymorphum]|jgi:hypothetical protein|uniref:dynamin family protein n=1 Tax=Fusobacterium nucleatum subsp. polymorphum TaxID=76857 RepID=UPI002B4C0B28|nr:dynamin family protein [Fusobacterium polymorphum]WRL78000.1 dynamin family protein [Fusobacterium polymorphum]
MKKIEISHNPYKTVTTIKMNGKEIGESKFDPYLRERFQLWVDKIPELLIHVFNEDILEVNFHGTELDYQDLKIELEKAENARKAKFILSHKKAKEFGEKEKDIRLIYDEASKLPFDTLKSNALKDAYEKAFDEKLEINIVATMSAGKSTLINSLVGKKLLPSKQGACTAIITKIEDDDDNTFKAIVLDKDNKEIGKYSNIDYKTMKSLNENKSVSEVNIKGNIPFVSSKDVSLIFVDTPGPDNAMDEKHAEITHKALNSSSKMLVLFVMNGGTLNNNSQKSFLQDIARSMSVGGKQSKERFIFVVNKIDEYKVDDDDIEKDVLEGTRKFLKQIGIENPNIFLVSAEIALGIKRLKNATSDEKQELLDEYKYKINKLNSNVQFHLEKYAKLPASSQQIIDKELEAAIKNDDKIEQALIHSGIRSLEEAISVYVTKYTRPSKIANIVNQLTHEFDSANAFADTKMKIVSEKGKREEYAKKIKKLNEKISSGEESKKFKKEIEKFSKEAYKNFEEKLNNLVIGVNTEELIRKLMRDQRKELETSEARRIVNEFISSGNELQKDFISKTENLLEKEIKERGDELIQDYIKQLNTISEDFKTTDLNLNLGSYVQREVNDLENISVQDMIDKAEDIKEEYHTETRSRTVIKRRSGWDRFFHPTEWFNPEYEDTEYYTVDVKDEIKFISLDKLIDNLVPKLDANIYKRMDETLEFAKKGIEKIKEFFDKKFEELDKILRTLTKNLEYSISSEEAAKKALEDAEKLLKNLEQIKSKLEKVLEI